MKPAGLAALLVGAWLLFLYWLGRTLAAAWHWWRGPTTCRCGRHDCPWKDNQ